MESFSELGPTGSSGIQFYPNDLDQGPFMKFSTYSMKGGVGSGMSDINYSGPFEHVCLPIPTGLNSVYGQGWDQEGVDEKVAGIQKAFEGATNAVNADPRGRTSWFDSAKGAVSGGVGAVMDSLKSAGIEDTMTSALLGVTGKVTKAAGQRATGKAVFQNQYMTYGGPGFREFQFAFALKALSKDDAISIESIVKFFKLNSAPQLRVGGLWRLYELPMVFRPTFHAKQGTMNLHLPLIGKCALTNVGVTYGGDRYSEFWSNHPVQVDLTLSFKEVALLSGLDIDAGY